MASYEIVQTNPDHVEYVGTHMREDDRREVWYSRGVPPLYAVRRGFHFSDRCRTALVEGMPAAIFGVVPVSLLDKSGSIWMLSTEHLNEIKFRKREIREIREQLSFLTENYNHVENWTHVGNKVALKLIRFLGFKMGEVLPVGKYQEPFQHFEMRLKHV